MRMGFWRAKTHKASEITSGRFPVDRLPAMTDEKIWKGTGTNVEEVDMPAVGVTYYHTESEKVSDNLRNSNDTERSKTGNAYQKIKEVLLNDDLAHCRLKMDIKSSHESYTVTARVYKNGGAIGTEQTQLGTSYATKSEDFSGWVSGDLIQIYAKTDSSVQDAYVRNMRFCYDADDVDTLTHLGSHTLETPLIVDVTPRDPTISMTNQDP